MYPSRFEYHRADSVGHAVELLHEYPGAELIAGGHSLLPTMKSGLASPDHLVDIGHIDAMRGIDLADGTVSIGALTTYADVVASNLVEEHATVVARAAREIGDVQVRNRGTIGGNLSHADPASDLPAAVLTADATLIAHGPDGARHIPVDDFFEGMYATALDEHEVLTRVDLPSRPGGVGVYAKRANPSSGYAIVGVAVSLAVEDGVVDAPRVAANGVVEHAVRLDAVEDALDGERLDDETITAAAGRASADVQGRIRMDDFRASSTFREHLLALYTERALTVAAEEAGVATLSA